MLLNAINYSLRCFVEQSISIFCKYITHMFRLESKHKRNFKNNPWFLSPLPSVSQDSHVCWPKATNTNKWFWKYKGQGAILPLSSLTYRTAVTSRHVYLEWNLPAESISLPSLWKNNIIQTVSLPIASLGQVMHVRNWTDSSPGHKAKNSSGSKIVTCGQRDCPPKKTASISAFSQLSSKGWLWHCQLQSQEKRMLGQQIGSDTVLLFTENLVKDIPHNDTFAPTVIISQLLFQEKTDSLSSDYSWLEYNMIQMEWCFFLPRDSWFKSFS